KSFLYSENILKQINLIDPDLIVFQFGFLPVLINKELPKIKQPFVVIHHGTDVNRARSDKKYRNNLVQVWKRASQVIFISNFLLERGLSLGCPKDKAIVLPLGVPLNKYLPTTSGDSNSK